MSPGVDTATRSPVPISRNGCRPAGRGAPNSVSQAAEPKPQTQDSSAATARVPTVRTRLPTSSHQARTAAALSAPGFSVATMKIA